MADDFNGEGALGGAASGAALGTQLMPGWGTAIGGVTGAIGGGLGLFGKGSKAPNFDDIIARRQAQIDAFGRQLESARNNVLSNYQNLSSSTMKNFMPQYEAMLNGRGLNVAGGAFASGVGREATQLQSGYNMLNTNMTENNLNTLAGMEQNLFGSTLNARMTPSLMNYQQGRETQQAYGSLLGSGMSMLGGLGQAGAFRGIFNGGTSNGNSPMQGLGGGNWFSMNKPSPYNDPDYNGFATMGNK